MGRGELFFLFNNLAKPLKHEGNTGEEEKPDITTGAESETDFTAHV